MSPPKSLLLVLCITAFSQSNLFGQCQTPDPYDIPNPLDDPNCPVNCSSKDLEIVGAYLDLAGSGCNACNEGDSVTAELFLGIKNTTGSNRTSFAIFGTLQIISPDGDTTICPISRCSGPIPGNSTVTKSYGNITYTCGEQLTFTDIILSWTDASPNSNCAHHDCAEVSPKCGTAAAITITPPLQSAATATCISGGTIDVNLTVQGGKAPFTYSWTGTGGTFSTEDLVNMAPGTYHVTVTDANGCSTTASASTLICDDGNLCTVDGCSKTTGCTATPVICDDDNVCTTDDCNPLTGCFATNNTNSCNDWDFCTDNDVCSDGSCSGTTIGCDDSNPCTDNFCNPNSGCYFIDNTAYCNDDNACTDNDVCSGGTCNGMTISCNDLNPCTDNSCDPNSGCVFTDNNATCNDANACTDDDICSGGTCTGFSITCDDFNPCTDNLCDPGSGCFFTNNVEPCDDNDLCTENDICSSGACGGEPKDCSDADLCTIDSCNNGICLHPPLCADTDPCTEDLCRVTGNCLFTPVSCDDNDLCTDDHCNSANGNCWHSPTDCSDGFDCTTDTCIDYCMHNFSNCDTTNVLEHGCPAKIIFVLDESGSIAGSGQGSIGVTSEVRNGSMGLLNALIGTEAQVAIVEFNTYARRAVVGGSSAYQTVDSSSIDDFIDYVNDHNTTAEDEHFDPEDYLSNNPDTYTNWEAALQLVQEINNNEGVADLVLFFTDGMPTAYINANGNIITGTASAVVNIALSEATAAANGVKLQGSHMFVVSFPNPNLPEANVQSISGPNKYPAPEPNFILADYSIETSATLVNSLSNIGNLICRADLRLAKKVSPAAVCAGDTVTFTITITNDGFADVDSVIVKDYIGNGYTYISDDGGSSTSFAGNILTWTIQDLLYTQSDSIKVTLRLNAVGNLLNVAQVTYSSMDDSDSEPGNLTGTPVEDDEAMASVSTPNCSDGIACTSDFCEDGACIHQPQHSLCNDNNACTDDVCDLNAGCTNTQNNALCNDGIACTNDRLSKNSPVIVH